MITNECTTNKTPKGKGVYKVASLLLNVVFGIYGIILFLGGMGANSTGPVFDHWLAELIDFLLIYLSTLIPDINGAPYIIMTISVLGISLFFQYASEPTTFGKE